MTNESPSKINNETNKGESFTISEAQKVIGDILDLHLKKLNSEKNSCYNPLHKDRKNRPGVVIYNEITETQKALDEIRSLQAHSITKNARMSDKSRKVINKLLDNTAKEIDLELEKTYHPKYEGSMSDHELDNAMDKQFSYAVKIKSIRKSINFMEGYPSR